MVLSGSGSEREFTQRLGRVLRPAGEVGGDGGDGTTTAAATDGTDDPTTGDGTDSGSAADGHGPDPATARAGRAVLYEVVTAETAEERVADRRR